MLRELKSPRGPRVLSILLGVLLLTHVTLAEPHGHHDKDDHHQTEQEHKDEDYHKISDRLDHVTARLEHLDHHLDKRLSPKIRQKAQSLDHYLSKFEDDHCDEHHYDCGGQDHECVSKLFVCDGHKDCRNGADESHCTLPTKAGDTFDGFQVYDHCDEGHFKKATMTIYEVQVRPAFPGFPLIKAIIKSAEGDKQNHVEVAYHLFGYYRFSTNRLVLFPPPGTEAGEDSGILCEFDGHNLDRCEAYVVNKVSLNRCAKFVFYRDRSHKRGGKDDHHDDEEHH